MRIMEEKVVIGLVEDVILKHNKIGEPVIARIDTGATKSSMDLALASKLKLGPVVATKLIKSASGQHIRPIIEATVEIAGKEIREKFTLADRSHMKYSILIGQNILKRGFLIDPNKE